MTTIIGLGQSVAGDDAVGLAVLDAIERRCLQHVELIRARDASQLVDLLNTSGQFILVDAVLVTTEQIGMVFVLSPEQLDERANSTVSSHGVSVAQAIELARAVHTSAKPRIQLVAIGIAQPQRLERHISKKVNDAIAKAADAVEALVRRAGDE